jgi:uncharacterized protein with HEPN domain
MTDRAYWRLTDMKNAIGQIKKLLDGKTSDVVATDIATRAAFERFLEIVSEASRHVPDEWKKEYTDIEWRQIADLGNFIRHVYHRIDLDILWTIYTDKLDPLEQVVDALIRRAQPDA